MALTHIAWLGKKTPFCGNVTYGLSTTEALRARGHQTSFIHFDNPKAPGSSTSLLANDPDVSLPYLVKSQVYTIPSPGAQRELRDSLERLQPDLVHASLTLSPLDFRLPELCQQLQVPLVAIPAQTTIQEDTPESQRGRVFGLQNNLINIALSLPLVLAGALVSSVGLLPVLWILAGLALVAALIERPWQRC